MRLVSWNLRHSVGATLDEVAWLIRLTEPDLLLMQEATAAIDRLPDLVGGHHARNPLPGRRHGLAAWSPLPFGQPDSLALQPGLFVRRICQIVTLSDLAIANVHLSHSQLLNRRQLRRIAEALPARAIIVGDCNMVGPALLPGFTEIGPRQPTHRMARIAALRLDRCFVRGMGCEGATVLPRGGSDHRPIVVEVG